MFSRAYNRRSLILLVGALYCGVPTIGCSLPARAVTQSNCALTPDRQLFADIPEGASALRFDIFNKKQQLLGRQIVLKPARGKLEIPVLSTEWGRLSPDRPVVKCTGDNNTRFERRGYSIDVGPDAEVDSLYLGYESIVLSFYAFGVGGPLFDQVYYVQLDDRQPYQVEVTASTDQQVVVRFSGVSPGRHQVIISSLSYAPPAMNARPDAIGTLEIIVPNDILGAASGDQK